VTGPAVRTPEQIERARARSRVWHARQRELAALALSVADSRDQASGRRLDSASGSLQQHPDHVSGSLQQYPDAERLAELERRVVELEVRDAAREAELLELRAYRQRNRDRSSRNATNRRQVKGTGTTITKTGTPEMMTGSRAGVATANAARVRRAPATGGISGRVNYSGGGGVSNARSTAAPAPPMALPRDDGALLDRLWTAPRVLDAIAQRGLNLEWERANFERKPQGRNPANWTVEYLVAWLLRSTVQVPDPTPITRVAIDRTPRQDQHVAAVACASSAYLHDPWAGRRPPIAEADLARGGVL
jgi:hypothetical protein